MYINWLLLIWSVCELYAENEFVQPQLDSVELSNYVETPFLWGLTERK